MGNVPANETFGGTYPFTPHYSEAPGFKMHYVDEGAGDPIVLVHGFPTWSYLYRNYIPVLSDKYRVIAPDHMGYGKSDSPQGRDYTFGGHGENFEKLMLDLDLRDITLVLHDIGGPIAAGFAYRHHDRIKRIVIQNTVMLGIDPEFELGVLAGGEENQAPYLLWIAERHAQGQFVNLYDNIDTTIHALFAGLPLITKTAWTPQLAEAYQAPWRDKAHRAAAEQMARAVYVPLIEGQGVSNFYFPTPEEVAAIKEKPAFMVCGMRDVAVMPQATIKIFKHQHPGKPVVELPDTGHFSPEDSGEAIAAMIDLFIQSS